jgi:RNA polymerase sigma factor (TIGR02999 family)
MQSSDEATPRADQLFQTVYAELRQLAAAHLAVERAGHTLTPTALVHEVYVRLAGGAAEWTGRTHFLCASAKAMRHILVSHARGRARLKRGGDWRRIDLEAADLAVDAGGWLDLDDALEALAAEDPVAAAVIELRFFAGATWADVAAAIQESVDAAKDHWAYAKAWLSHRLGAAD